MKRSTTTAQESARGNSPGWKCSKCGALITRIEDGWVEWLACEDEGVTFTRGLRLVHRTPSDPQASCQYDLRQEFQRDRSLVEGLPLERFVGPDGLMFLLSLISSGDMQPDEIIELAKRVQIPGYELAREQFRTAIENGVLSPSIGEGFYLQSEIQSLLSWVTVV